METIATIMARCPSNKALALLWQTQKMVALGLPEQPHPHTACPSLSGLLLGSEVGSPSAALLSLPTLLGEVPDQLPMAMSKEGLEE